LQASGREGHSQAAQLVQAAALQGPPETEEEAMMNRCSTLAMLVVSVLATPVALGAVPDFVTYSDRLTDGTAWGQSQTEALTFRICDKAEGGTMLHEQVFGNAAVEDGYFSVMLTGVAEVFGAHDATWITVCVGQGCLPADDLLPRQQVGSVPYAAKADTAQWAWRTSVVGNNKRCSTNAVFKGASKGVSGGSFLNGGSGTAFSYEGLTGYQAAKRVCEVSLGSETAHMCTMTEILWSLQLGVSVSDSNMKMLIATGTVGPFANLSGNYYYMNDCFGWTINSHPCADAPGHFCSTVIIHNGAIQDYPCGSSANLACCDFGE